jgi:hypothetical protein
MAFVTIDGTVYEVPEHPNTIGIVDHVFRNDEILFVELYEPKPGMQATQFVRHTNAFAATIQPNFSAGYLSVPSYRTNILGVYFWTQETVFSFEKAYLDRQLPDTNNYRMLDNPNFKIYKTPVDIGMILEHSVPAFYEQYTPSVELESLEYNTDYSDDNLRAMADRTIESYAGEFGITALLNTDSDAINPPLYQADVSVQLPICNYVTANDVTEIIQGGN